MIRASDLPHEEMHDISAPGQNINISEEPMEPFGVEMMFTACSRQAMGQLACVGNNDSEPPTPPIDAWPNPPGPKDPPEPSKPFPK